MSIHKDAVSIPATLALRPDEIRTYNSMEPDASYNMYVVCLATTPKYPPGTISDRISPFTVLCMQFSTWGRDTFPSWGWVHLDPDTKYRIGQDLEELGVDSNKWAYLTLGT